MSYAFSKSWDLLLKKDDYPKKRVIDRRILVPKDPSASFNQRARGNNNTQISAGGNVVSATGDGAMAAGGKVNTNSEPNPMDAAMEEIRAAQAQREAQAKQFEQMMSGSFANAFPQNISQEMADMIAAFKLQGMSNQQATELARQRLGE